MSFQRRCSDCGCALPADPPSGRDRAHPVTRKSNEPPVSVTLEIRRGHDALDYCGACVKSLFRALVDKFGQTNPLGHAGPPAD